MHMESRTSIMSAQNVIASVIKRNFTSYVPLGEPTCVSFGAFLLSCEIVLYPSPFSLRLSVSVFLYDDCKQPRAVTYSITYLLQISMNTKMRSNAFAAYGALSAYGAGSQHHAFLEQVTPSFHSGCFNSTSSRELLSCEPSYRMLL